MFMLPRSIAQCKHWVPIVTNTRHIVMKRKTPAEPSDGTVSPPPIRNKRKVESTTSKKAVANFFTPTSKKAPQTLTWRTVNESLLVGRYSAISKDESKIKRQKIAAFDFDSTLISTSSGNVFGKDASDWKWWQASVPNRLKELYADGYLVAILSNQSGITLKNNKDPKAPLKRLETFKTKAGFVLNQLDIPLSIYAATAKDHYRKPRSGMWKELLEDHDLDVNEGPDLEGSFFVGDAAGRAAKQGVKADHSCSDRNFAANIGIEFKTPEEYFLGAAPEPFRRTFDPLLYVDEASSTPEEKAVAATSKSVIEKLHTIDIVLLCGSPGSGKSTFYSEYLAPLGYARVNQDTLKTRDKCLKVAGEHLSEGTSVAVDNTNADPATRAHWISLAQKYEIPIRCVHLETPVEVCMHNDTVRALNMDAQFNPEKRSILPAMAFTGFSSRYRVPEKKEGFHDIVTVPFKFRGGEGQRAIWGRYWT